MRIANKIKGKVNSEIVSLKNEEIVPQKEAHPRKPRAKYFGELIQMDASNEEINLYLSRYCERIVDKGHSIKMNNKYYFILNEKGEVSYLKPKTVVSILKTLDEKIYALLSDKTYELKEIESHERISKEFDGEEKNIKREKYIPPANHPWRIKSFKNYMEKCSSKNKIEYEEIYS